MFIETFMKIVIVANTSNIYKMTSATETSHPDMRKLEIPDANFSFHYMPVDEELILPLFPGLILDGPRERLLAIRGWETRQDDIFLTSFPKAGMEIFNFMHTCLSCLIVCVWCFLTADFWNLCCLPSHLY